MTRNLANILIDLSEARHRNDTRDRQFQAATDEHEKERLSNEMAAEDRIIGALEIEARQMIEVDTGVQWSAIERAGL